MTKTILGFIAVILCSALLMPLLVDTTPLSAVAAAPSEHQIVVAGLFGSR